MNGSSNNAMELGHLHRAPSTPFLGSCASDSDSLRPSIDWIEHYENEGCEVHVYDDKTRTTSLDNISTILDSSSWHGSSGNVDALKDLLLVLILGPQYRKTNR